MQTRSTWESHDMERAVQSVEKKTKAESSRDRWEHIPLQKKRRRIPPGLDDNVCLLLSGEIESPPPSIGDDTALPEIQVKTREPEQGCGEVKILWDETAQHNLHTYPLAKRLGLIRSMPDKPDTWPPFHIPATMATSQQLDLFLDIVYNEDDSWRWVGDGCTEVADLLGVMRLCSYFQFDELEEGCVDQLADRLRSAKGSAAPELLAVWQFLSSVKNPRLRTIALAATVKRFESDYNAAKTEMSAAGVWECLDRNDMEHMLKRSLERVRDLHSEWRAAIESDKKAKK